MPQATRNLFIFSVLSAFLTLTACTPAPDQKKDVQDWPTNLTPPIEGATFSLAESHLPGAPRNYRAGANQGFDFINGLSGRPLAEDEPIVAIADGEVVRIDHDYTEPSPDNLAFWVEQAKLPGFTGDYALDRLRGRQVWLRHADGHISRYAHLSMVHPELHLGDSVQQGRPIGLMGNSGLLPSEEQPSPPPRLHFELWSPDESTYLGQGLSPLEIHQHVAAAFGADALPRYARAAVERARSGQGTPESYPPETLPETSFSVDPPKTVAAGSPFAVPITWEGDQFQARHFQAALDNMPLGIIDAGDGAWILGAMPLQSAGSEVQLTILATDPFGNTLSGTASIRSQSVSDPTPPIEVSAGAYDLFSEENIQLERERLLRAGLYSLSIREPQWSEPFGPPLEGTLLSPFGQKRYHGVTLPDYPRPGVLIDVNSDTTVRAANSGTVVVSESLPIRGNTVAISHGGGIVSVYAGLDSIDLEKGVSVERGQVLGSAEGGLQWEVHVAGVPSNPLIWLDKLLPRP